MKIKEYTPEYRAEWNDFVLKSNNGTVFAHQSFFDYHPPERFIHKHLMFYYCGKLVALFPAAEAERTGGNFLVSHPGASFGGLILKSRTGTQEAILAVKSLIDYAKTGGYEGLEMTCPPWIYYRFPENYVDFAMFLAGAIHRKRELTAIVPLMNKLDENLAFYKPTARTSMRKAIKAGVEIMMSDNYKAFYEILEQSLNMRHGVAPTHTIEELHRLEKLMPDKVTLFGAYYKGKMVAGTLLFKCNPRTILAFYISQDYEHQKLRPLNLLFTEVFRWGIKGRFKWLDFGTYTLDNVPNLGLARFKESLGAKGIFRDTLSLPFGGSEAK